MHMSITPSDWGSSTLGPPSLTVRVRWSYIPNADAGPFLVAIRVGLLLGRGLFCLAAHSLRLATLTAWGRSTWRLALNGKTYVHGRADRGIAGASLDALLRRRIDA